MRHKKKKTMANNLRDFARHRYARNYEPTGVPARHVEVDGEHSGMF